MRLGLSTILTAALAVGLMACSSSTGDGAGGSGGTGAGGDDDTTTGAGGDDAGTTTGAGGGEGGGTSDGVCDFANAPIEGDSVLCDPDCEGAFPGESGLFAQCTITCDPTGDGAECGDLTCFDDGEGSGVCLYSCDGVECPGSGLYTCDQDALFCNPDGVSE